MTSYKSEWEQIHAQIDAIVRAIPEHFLLDPPDGGDVTVAEGVQRMAARIEQLQAEAKTRTLDYLGQVGQLSEELERLRAALLTGVCMLSEMGLDPREKCQMAYDYMSVALEERT